ncbi:tail protein [Vibrio phage Athena]|uniref:DUF7265 domain-containing protein n=9 Tax=Thalassavirus TaxID=2948922 RepID=A0A6M4ES89_9CAUD|nr:tail protein [Vibrio phage Achelous]YP_010102554.1 tail protein [Vibrio phage Brizo]YP_010105714.1 tail protein [Vibrio phage Bennett]YP_010105905.1 tail protein [Vibrio phage Chester]YP_010108163.1 tail protein [Vibrio phage AG74]YP_010108353.1 tail protein [Vibrio phage Cody]YP_010108547.1 tail protein [Vibrio phage Quinn]YP_010108741.1 tail protein [Vibrio phage Athena]YP_010114293.1 tail protein [Vibrio phage Gary]QIG66240.1 hypothetical protein CILSICK_141 [Vibrio phage Cilsick]QI
MAYQIFTSDKKGIGEIIELPISPEYAHCFAGVRYFDSNDDQIVPTSGSVNIKARHLTNNNYDDVVNADLDASEAGAEAEWGGNVTSVKATPSSLAGTDLATYQVVVVQNLS